MTDKDYQIAMDAIKKVPDIRQEKIDQIKEKFEKGYNVTNEEFIEKILNNIQKTL